MSVDDPLCFPRLTYEGSCGVDITYSSSQHTVGFVGRDNAYFQEAKTGEVVGFGGFSFGCALKNDGFEFDKNMRDNVIIGIFGLALGPRSFLSQLGTETNGRFSYCLAPDRGLSTMYFGDDAQISGDATREVQTIAMNKMLKYHIYVKGISVNGIRLSIDLSVFEFDPIRNNNGFFVDSAAPYTLIPKSAYNTLKAAVVMYFREKYGWQPLPMPRGEESNLCYATYPSDVQGFPSVIFHFTGIRQEGEINWIMNNNYLFTKINEGFCMTILSLDEPGPSLFGAHQQINFKILFDVVNGLLSFVPQNCQEASL
ncbi:aspartic proteinase nepenthesin-1-like [Silene latifolia]|uniref:aspartic proteinase nepenthesin-1-like n=1 Tax=Silene latifolia TaxID=37657 RepID=UPI003D7829EF